MKQAKKMQDEIIRHQEMLGKKIVISTSGGGAIKFTINCKHEVVELEIDKMIVDADNVDVLIDLIKVAINDANLQIIEATEEVLSKLTGGLIVPDKIKIMEKEK